MRRTAVAELPLHPGRAPPWLFRRMVDLSREIFRVLSDEFSPEEVLLRLSNPFWFQALSMLLGFDWHSSGTTTVTCGALAEALTMEEHGVAVLGGKGGRSRKVPEQIEALIERGLLDASPEELKRASRLTAKVDTAAVQDGYRLYHHTFFVDDKGHWAVVQQGMNEAKRMARRYHWISQKLRDFTTEPHTAILGDGRQVWVLNLTARESAAHKKVLLDLIREGPKEVREGEVLIRRLQNLSRGGQSTLEFFEEGLKPTLNPLPPFYLSMPFHIDWEAVKRLYEKQPEKLDDVLEEKGVGPSLLRSLSLTAQLIYGEPPSWRDPIKYSFAVGGKDGVPYPVDRRTYDRTISALRRAVEEARVGRKEKLAALRRLAEFERGKS